MSCFLLDSFQFSLFLLFTFLHMPTLCIALVCVFYAPYSILLLVRCWMCQNEKRRGKKGNNVTRNNKAGSIKKKDVIIKMTEKVEKSGEKNKRTGAAGGWRLAKNGNGKQQTTVLFHTISSLQFTIYHLQSQQKKHSPEKNTSKSLIFLSLFSLWKDEEEQSNKQMSTKKYRERKDGARKKRLIIATFTLYIFLLIYEPVNYEQRTTKKGLRIEYFIFCNFT